tara:strand:- start:1637 stop:2200 length:564 start_codon:yes stop_codon:yes gene_type:complete
MKHQDLLEIIKNRRNTKQFSEKEVDNADIKVIIESAVWAPNHRNTEPWRFVVISKTSPIKNNISNGLINLQENNQKKLNEDQKKDIVLGVEKTPLYIFVFTEISENPEISEENYGAVCCAIQNMQLTATTLGLGVGWSTGKISKIDNLNSILGIDVSLKIVGVLSIGYPSTVVNKTRIDHDSLTKWL